MGAGPKVCTEPWRSQDEEKVRGGWERVSGEEAGHLSEISSPACLSPHFLGQKVESSPLWVLVLLPWVTPGAQETVQALQAGLFLIQTVHIGSCVWRLSEFPCFLDLGASSLSSILFFPVYTISQGIDRHVQLCIQSFPPTLSPALCPSLSLPSLENSGLMSSTQDISRTSKCRWQGFKFIPNNYLSF